MYSHFVKRFIDIIFSSLILIISSPIMLLTAILIKVDSRGPIIYKQVRLGINENKFMILKFRTMTNKERKVHKNVFKDDPEVTYVGKYLRRFKVDELPQIFNVIKGEMTIVGPRPCLPEIKSLFGKYSIDRFKVKPGLTSLAAIKGSIYLSWEEKGFWDALYTRKVSFNLDTLIILKTIIVIFKGEDNMFNKRK